jgi:hypothetical protein
VSIPEKFLETVLADRLIYKIGEEHSARYVVPAPTHELLEAKIRIMDQKLLSSNQKKKCMLTQLLGCFSGKCRVTDRDLVD